MTPKGDQGVARCLLGKRGVSYRSKGMTAHLKHLWDGGNVGNA
jgi:hypothetical protein